MTTPSGPRRSEASQQSRSSTTMAVTGVMGGTLPDLSALTAPALLPAALLLGERAPVGVVEGDLLLREGAAGGRAVLALLLAARDLLERHQRRRRRLVLGVRLRRR